MLDTLIQDLRYAVRSLRSSPGFTAVAILSLALGIGANSAIFSLVNSLILRSLPVRHPEELVQVWVDDNSVYTNPIWEQIRDRQDVFSGVSAFAGTRFNLAAGGEARSVQAYFTSGQFFETLSVRPFAGRVYSVADDKRECPGVAVLSHSFWEREYGGNPDVIGKTISLDAHPFEIIGVAQAGFVGINVGLSKDVFVPLCAEPIVRGENSQLDRRANWWLQIIARPKPGVTPAQLSARLDVLSPGIFEAAVPLNYNSRDRQSFLNAKLSVRPAANGLSTIRSQYRLALLTLMAAVGAVLLIACLNVANLLLARGAARQREVAIRMALGSSRVRLMSQFLTESLLLSFLGATLGVGFAQWGSHILVRLISSTRSPVYLDLGVDGRVLGFTAGVAILSGLLFGLAPAWRGTHVPPQSAMKANGRGVVEGSKFGLGKALVTLQVALSLVLVTGAGLMMSTFFKLSAVDTGFDRDRVLLVQVDLRKAGVPAERRSAAFEQIMDSFRAIPGVRSVSGSDNTPISGNTWSGDVAIDGDRSRSSASTHVYFNQVSSRFFETLRTPLMAGRDFDAHDTLASPKVAIVNQSMATRLFGDENPLGKHFRAVNTGSTVGDREIVGVVRDAKYSDLREAAPPTAYIALSQDAKPGPFCNFEIRASTGHPSALIPAVNSTIANVNRDVVLQFTTLATQVGESISRERLLATLSGFFGGLALLLAMIGLYGVMSHNVARRRNEIGIRMALGAERSSVLRMVLGEVAVVVAIGLAIGLGASLGTARFIASFLYGMKANDPWTLGSAAGTLAVIAVVAGFIPARRASRLDPMTALREE